MKMMLLDASSSPPSSSSLSSLFVSFAMLLFLLSMTTNYIWKPPAYPYELQPQLISILQMFEVAFQMPDSNFLLVPSLLPLEKPRI